MKYFAVILTILFINIFCFTAFTGERSEKCVIGYGYSAAVLPSERQEHFFMGFRYGLQSGFAKLPKANHTCSSYDNVVIERVVKTGKGPLDAFHAAKELINKNVVLLAGFPTSHEALLAARVAQKSNVALVIPGAGASDLRKYGKYIFTLSPPNMDYVEEQMSDWIKSYMRKNVLVVVKKDAIFSVDMLRTFEEYNHENGNKVNLLPVYVNSNLQIDEDVLRKHLSSGISTVFITMYASESKSVFLQLLQQLPPTTEIFVSSAWPIGDLKYLNDIRSQFKNPISSIAIWAASFGKKQKDSFYNSFKKKYNFPPEVEAAHGYEAGVVAANVLHASKESSSSSILDSMRSVSCISVDTVGEICRKSSGFSERRFFKLKWKSDGFER